MSKIYRIRVTGDVLETVNATRRHNIDGEVITFGREPVYSEADELPEELADDNYLRIDTVDSAPAGVRVIQKKKRLPPPGWEDRKRRLPPPDDGGLEELKSERVQEPESVTAGPGDTTKLKSERVQHPQNRKRP